MVEESAFNRFAAALATLCILEEWLVRAAWSSPCLRWYWLFQGTN